MKLLLLDSMGKGLGDIRNARTMCLPGATPNSMLCVLKEIPDLKSYDIILIHVGTNFMSNKAE